MRGILKTLLIGAACAALGAAGSASAAVNLIANGGFNNGDVDGAPGGFVTLSAGSGALTGWSVVGGTVDWIRGYWESADGDGYSIDLNGGSAGILTQTIATEAGRGYTLTFSMSGNPDSFRGETRIAVIGAGGNTIGTATYDLSALNSRTSMLWETRSFGFVADGAATEIRFTSGNPDPADSGNCCWGAALDNVAVNVVPEPATWGLMIAGFGAAGVMLRRRRTALA